LIPHGVRKAIFSELVDMLIDLLESCEEKDAVLALILRKKCILRLGVKNEITEFVNIATSGFGSKMQGE